ncbi:MAG: NAD(P)H-dependent oxidoreductase [Dysgonamonadaceae bacterium]|nr:NAD(P)H-dependent oxidoreductase [Dysgonamonadaceae bacterium]MDD4730219.1 NAD(P)H-dependent oxidoreductase [Dysgonamonadaceae bacterium]
MDKYKIAVIVGSLRKESYNLKIANTLIEQAPESLFLEIVDIADLPIFNEDLENTPLSEWEAFRKEIKAVDGVIFLTPEHNRSIPAALKNAIDTGSRPYGQNVWDGKPGAIISASVGSMSGFGANHHLRQILVGVNVPVMVQPEVYIGGAADLFDGEGKLINESTRDFLSGFMNAFEKWVDANVQILQT